MSAVDDVIARQNDIARRLSRLERQQSPSPYAVANYSGTPVAGQVAYWTAAGTIAAASGVTYPGAGTIAAASGSDISITNDDGSYVYRVADGGYTIEGDVTNNAKIVRQAIRLASITSSQVMTIDVVTNANARMVLTKVYVTCGRNGATIFAYIYGTIAWSSPAAGGTATLRDTSDVSMDSTSATKPTVTAIANGFRLTITGASNTMDQNMIYLESSGYNVSHAITVTVT